MKAAPFSRALFMLALVREALRLPFEHDRQTALAAIGPYESRGKGRGGWQKSRRTVAMDKRATLKARNKRRSK